MSSGDIPDVSAFITSGDVPDVSAFVTSGAIPDISGFITAGAISGFITSGDVSSADYSTVAGYFSSSGSYVSVTKDADTQTISIGHTGILAATLSSLVSSVSDLGTRVAALEAAS